MLKLLKNFLIATICLTLISCSAMHTAIKKKNLDIQTKMSNTIFLNPVAPEQKTIFVEIKNTSDKQDLSIEQQIKGAIATKGYAIVQDPNKANYLLQANVLQVGKADLRAANEVLSGGFGSAMGGAVIGAAGGSLASSHRDGVVIGALVGAGVSALADALIKDVSYSIITDIQISEKTKAAVSENVKSNLQQGTTSKVKVRSKQDTNWKRYQTRILSTANKVNLKFEEALPYLVTGLSNSISGLM